MPITLQQIRAADPNHILNRIENALGDRRAGVTIYLGRQEHSAFISTAGKYAGFANNVFLGVPIKVMAREGIEIR